MDYQINNNATIEVLPESNLVEILGNVYNPGLVQYKRGTLRVYFSGGYKEDTLKKEYVKRANGHKEGLFFGATFKNSKR